MMRNVTSLTLIISLVLCLGQALWAQPGTLSGGHYPAGQAGTDFNVNNAKNNKEGNWVRVWPNGNLYYVGQFKDGVPSGQFKFFFETGELMSEVTHIDNGGMAFTKLYRRGGSLQAEGTYMSSRKLNEQGEPVRLKHGEWVYYDANGQARLKENYNMDVLHGKAVTLSKNGKRLEEGDYADGERDGTWKTWDEFTNVLSEMSYRDGVFHGMCKINYANGRPQTVGMFDTGKENGYWKSFLEDGTVQTTRQFDHGQLIKEIHENGPVLLTFPDGRPREEFEVVDQRKTGPFREWHDTGEWTIEESIDPETGDPIRKRILKGDAIRREGEYINGKLDGDVYNYDLSGRLLLIERYEDGRLKSSEKQ
ncbi:MAG: hypothetical protein CL828_08335 [Crocinitomicaceae bacterium]|nr:hypothetical protein [Crocinitomicaceae bacterium]